MIRIDQIAAASSARVRAARGAAARCGVGLKAAHYRDILETTPPVGFFEIHAENYMGDGGPPHRYLEIMRARYPLSVHGVGLSLGGAEPLDEAHLHRLRKLIDRYQPELFSEHLAWSVQGGRFLNDLLPIPYTDASLTHVAERIDRAQSFLGRTLLLENPSTYVTFRDSDWPETDFLAELARRTGCGLLLDVNNVAVCAANHGFDPCAYLDAFPIRHVGEIHLAGYAAATDRDGHAYRIDAHGSAVADDVWRLFEHALIRCGPVASLVEWDNDVPAWSVLAAQALIADSYLDAAIPPPIQTETRHARAG